MDKEYINAFIVGSSWPVFIIYFLLYFNIANDKKKYSNENYAILAPLYLGLVNLISLYIGKKLGLQNNLRHFLTAIFAVMTIITFVKYNNVYDFSNDEWIQYYTIVILVYLFVFNFILHHIGP